MTFYCTNEPTAQSRENAPSAVNIDELERLAAEGPLVLRQPDAIALLVEVRRLQAAASEGLDGVVELGRSAVAEMDALRERLTVAQESLRADREASHVVIAGLRAQVERTEQERDIYIGQIDAIARALGCVHEQSMGADHPGSAAEVLASIRGLREQLLDYAETLARTRREAADRLSTIQAQVATAPSVEEVALLRRYLEKRRLNPNASMDYHELRATRAWIRRRDEVRP